MLPKLAIHTLQVTPLGENNYRINLVVENTGYLPTYTSEQGKKRKAIRPVRLELELPAGARLVNGRSRVELGHLEGRSNKFDVTTCWGESPTDNRLAHRVGGMRRTGQQPEAARAERTRRIDPPRNQVRLSQDSPQTWQVFETCQVWGKKRGEIQHPGIMRCLRFIVGREPDVNFSTRKSPAGGRDLE